MQIVGLVLVEQNLAARGQRRVDKKAGGAEVVARHGLTVARRQPASVYALWRGSARPIGQLAHLAAFPTHSGCYKPLQEMSHWYNTAETGEVSPMRLRWAMVALCMVPLCAGVASAQFQPVQPAPPQQEPPCVKEFFKLRDDAEKKATGDQGGE